MKDWIIRYYSYSGKYLRNEIVRGKAHYETMMYAKLRTMKDGRYTIYEWKGA